MSEKKHANYSKTRYESICDLNILGFLWLESGSEWSSIIREECLTAINPPVEEEEDKSINRGVLLAVLMILALLSVATWMKFPEISQTMQEVGRNSVKQLFLKDYPSAFR